MKWPIRKNCASRTVTPATGLSASYRGTFFWKKRIGGGNRLRISDSMLTCVCEACSASLRDRLKLRRCSSSLAFSCFLGACIVFSVEIRPIMMGEHQPFANIDQMRTHKYVVTVQRLLLNRISHYPPSCFLSSQCLSLQPPLSAILYKIRVKTLQYTNAGPPRQNVLRLRPTDHALQLSASLGIFMQKTADAAAPMKLVKALDRAETLSLFVFQD